MVRGPYIFEDLMATNDTSMQEYGLFQVSYAGHRADIQLGSLDLIAHTDVRALVKHADPALTGNDAR